MSDPQSKTTDDRHICDYPICSVRGSGHPLACNCRSSTIPTTEPDWRADPLENTPIVRGYQPQTAAGHTDLMISPESLDAWLDANPPPDETERLRGETVNEPSRESQLESALRAALEVIKDYLSYNHNGDPWVEDARSMGEMDINDYAVDGRMEYALKLLDQKSIT